MKLLATQGQSNNVRSRTLQMACRNGTRPTQGLGVQGLLCTQAYQYDALRLQLAHSIDCRHFAQATLKLAIRTDLREQTAKQVVYSLRCLRQHYLLHPLFCLCGSSTYYQCITGQIV